MRTTKEIRAALKTKLGYNSRQVSVKERQGGLSWSFTLTVRDASVNLKKVEEFAKGNEDIDRCQASGEILSGGNTFMFVRVTEEVEAAWAEKYINEVESGLASLEASKFNSARINDRVSIFSDDYWVTVYVDGRGGMRFAPKSAKAIATYLYKKLEF